MGGRKAIDPKRQVVSRKGNMEKAPENESNAWPIAQERLDRRRSGRRGAAPCITAGAVKNLIASVDVRVHWSRLCCKWRVFRERDLNLCPARREKRRPSCPSLS